MAGLSQGGIRDAKIMPPVGTRKLIGGKDRLLVIEVGFHGGRRTILLGYWIGR